MRSSAWSHFPEELREDRGHFLIYGENFVRRHGTSSPRARVVRSRTALGARALPLRGRLSNRATTATNASTLAPLLRRPQKACPGLAGDKEELAMNRGRGDRSGCGGS